MAGTIWLVLSDYRHVSLRAIIIAPVKNYLQKDFLSAHTFNLDRSSSVIALINDPDKKSPKQILNRNVKGR